MAIWQKLITPIFRQQQVGSLTLLPDSGDQWSNELPQKEKASPF
jgi:hypothetical protein